MVLNLLKQRDIYRYDRPENEIEIDRELKTEDRELNRQKADRQKERELRSRESANLLKKIQREKQNQKEPKVELRDRRKN